MDCPKCHQPVQVTHAFCPLCGAQVKAKGALPAISAVPNHHTDTSWSLPPLPGDRTDPLQQASAGRGVGYASSNRVESAPPDFEGIVTEFAQRDEADTGLSLGLGPVRTMQRKIIIWSFRVRRRDLAGYEIVPPIPIEMRGYTLSNTIQNGDRVRIPYAWKAGQPVQAEQVYNVSTTSWVTVETPGPRPGPDGVKRSRGSVISILLLFGGLSLGVPSAIVLPFASAIIGAMTQNPPSEVVGVANGFATTLHVALYGSIGVSAFMILAGVFMLRRSFKQSRALMVSLSIGTVVVIAFFALMVIVSTSQSNTVSPPSSTPQQTLQDACSHFGSGDMYKQDMTANYRQHVDLSTFLKRWDRVKFIDSCDQIIDTHDGNSVTGTIVVKFFMSDLQTYAVTLIKESDGVWRIDQLTLQ